MLLPGPSSPALQASARGPVGNAAEEMDAAVGHIADAVTAAGLDESTVYFFTSDNGAPLANDQLGNGPLRDGKTTTWEVRGLLCPRCPDSPRKGEVEERERERESEGEGVGSGVRSCWIVCLLLPR